MEGYHERPIVRVEPCCWWWHEKRQDRGASGRARNFTGVAIRPVRPDASQVEAREPCDSLVPASMLLDAAMLALLYGGGFRRSEAVALQFADYDATRNFVNLP